MAKMQAEAEARFEAAEQARNKLKEEALKALADHRMDVAAELLRQQQAADVKFTRVNDAFERASEDREAIRVSTAKGFAEQTRAREGAETASLPCAGTCTII